MHPKMSYKVGLRGMIATL